MLCTEAVRIDASVLLEMAPKPKSTLRSDCAKHPSRYTFATAGMETDFVMISNPSSFLYTTLHSPWCLSQQTDRLAESR